MRFREHRATLEDSLKTLVSVETREALVRHLKTVIWPLTMTDEEIERKLVVGPYGYDERIGWQTYIVLLSDYGVLGFTDSEF
jgi:hypothetical protein